MDDGPGGVVSGDGGGARTMTVGEFSRHALEVLQHELGPGGLAR
jgi:hypothetical protein